MRLRWHAAVGFLGLLLGNPCRAEAPDPLRLIPDQADVLLKIEQPRSLVEVVLNHPLVKDLYRIDAIHDLYNSTNARRFYQLIAYFEKQLGARVWNCWTVLPAEGLRWRSNSIPTQRRSC